MSPSRLVPIVASFLLILTGSPRGDDASLKAALEKPIVAPRQTLAEVQAFTESRLPRMPAVKSADEWLKTAEQLRASVHEKVIFRGEAARWRDAKYGVVWGDVIEGGPGYRIKKLRFEAAPGLWVPALLYEPADLVGKVPVVLNVNGHDSQGKAADYKQIRCINLAKRGILALNLEWFGMGQLATPGNVHPMINSIDLCGTSGIATHFLAQTRGLDILLAHENADPSRVGVTGLSGGGWQTIFVSGLDPRVTLTDPVAGYSSFFTRVKHFSDLGDSEQTPCDLATVADYTHLTAMVAPHPALLTFNQADNCCFAAPHALPPLLEAARPIYRLFGREGSLRGHINIDPGTHNYLLDNRQAFYQIIADFWSTNARAYNPREIPSDHEVKSAEELNVELPADNLDLKGLAVALAKSLPIAANRPSEREAAASWQDARRLALRRVIRPFDGTAEPTEIDTAKVDATTVKRLTVKVDRTWTVPVVELSPESPKATTLLLCQDGRASDAAVKRTAELLKDGRRVVTVDPFYYGESKVADHDYLFALMLNTVGERPLGVQVGQVLSIAELYRTRHPDEPVSLVGIGPSMSAIALAAGALDSKVESVEVHHTYGSLRELLDQGRTFPEAPELFTFGLLKEFDLLGITELVAPRKVSLQGVEPQVAEQFASLKSWYALLGAPESAP
jgi:hypothetical protein